MCLSSVEYNQYHVFVDTLQILKHKKEKTYEEQAVEEWLCKKVKFFEKKMV